MLHRMDFEVVTLSKTFLYTWVIKDYSFKSIFVEDDKGVFFWKCHFRIRWLIAGDSGISFKLTPRFITLEEAMGYIPNFWILRRENQVLNSRA